MKTVIKSWQFWSAGLYAWLITIFFGATLLDILYSRLVSSRLPASAAEAIFSEAADLLLLIGGLALLAGILAVGFAWSTNAARWLLLASLAFALSEFLAPALLSPLLPDVQAGAGAGPGLWIRLVLSGLASLLAFAGLWKLALPPGWELPPD